MVKIGVKHTEATKRKISKAQKGRHHSEETILKMSGQNNSFYGKHHTKEAKREISKAQKGNTSGKANKGKKLSEEHRSNISKGMTESWKRRKEQSD